LEVFREHGLRPLAERNNFINLQQSNNRSAENDRGEKFKPANSIRLNRRLQRDKSGSQLPASLNKNRSKFKPAGAN
jgi:hypothetical protein